MKKLFFLLISAILLVSCETKNVEIHSTETIINGRTIHFYVIDSCEYLGNICGANADILTHKGNCKFCTQRNKKSKE